MKIPVIENLLGRCNKADRVPVNYGDKYIYTGIEGDRVINEVLQKGEPCLIARFGSVELATVREFKRNKRNRKIDVYTSSQRYSMKNSAGFFPVTNPALTRFACEFLDVVTRIDVLGCWYRPYEKEICMNYMQKSSKLVFLENINPITSPIAWSKHLAGMKVLVIHPFAELIESQYKKRYLLFENKDILPDFELITYKPVQSIADNHIKYNYESWFEALDDMKKDIRNIDFDIAVVGAGAYGIFLADFCKSLGKMSIHAGGATQLLFGIKGKRWDECGFYNDYWVRPSEREKPLGYEKVEGGCYW